MAYLKNSYWMENVRKTALSLELLAEVSKKNETALPVPSKIDQMAKILSLLPKQKQAYCKNNFKLINPEGNQAKESDAPDNNESIVAKILDIRKVIAGLRTC